MRALGGRDGGRSFDLSWLAQDDRNLENAPLPSEMNPPHQNRRPKREIQPVIDPALAVATSEPFPDAGNIAVLELRVIPWQEAGTDAQEKRRLLREKPKAHPLLAAEGVFRKSARTSAPGAGESGTAGEFARQAGQILRWGKRQARLIDRRLEARLAALGGVEHEVFLDDDSGRWLKLTMPGKGGKEIHVRETRLGVRPTLITEDALLSDYLHRLRLANERLGDDFWLHGVMPHPAGPRLVVSQRHIKGDSASPGEVTAHFTEAGFHQVNAKTFYQPQKNLLVSDAHVGNVLRTREGIAPFDVCVQQPRDALLRAVLPAPTLSFDDWGDEDDHGQAGLGF